MSTRPVRNDSYVLGQNVAIISYSPGRAQKNCKLAISGPYAYVRRPQYSAFVLVMLGFLVQWPTILTLIMFPILVWVYKKLARREERDTWQNLAKNIPDIWQKFRDLYHVLGNLQN